jgi:Tfp pilus assembly protein PilF
VNAQAIGLYTAAIELCATNAEESAAFFANRGACKLKLGDAAGCEADCTAALDLKPEYVRVCVCVYVWAYVHARVCGWGVHQCGLGT